MTQICPQGLLITFTDYQGWEWRKVKIRGKLPGYRGHRFSLWIYTIHEINIFSTRIHGKSLSLDYVFSTQCFSFLKKNVKVLLLLMVFWNSRSSSIRKNSTPVVPPVLEMNELPLMSSGISWVVVLNLNIIKFECSWVLMIKVQVKNVFGCRANCIC